MQENPDKSASPLYLSARYQVLTVAGFAAVAALALALLFLGPGNGESASEQLSKPTYFVPDSGQAASMRLATIETRSFHNETITDGYVAANGAWSAAGAPAARLAAGMPVLAGQSADLLQGESDLATAAAQLRNAQTNEQRQHKLFEADGAALRDWQQSQTDLTTAAASFETARNKLRLLGKSDQDIRGIVSSARKAAAGGLAQGEVFAVGDPSLVWLVANVREADAQHVHPGDTAEVRVPALPNKVFRVTISYLSSSIDPTTHRLAAGGVVRNADGALKPNMQANFDIIERAGANAPAIPEAAVIYEGDQARVWTVDANGRYSLHNIAAGRTQAGYVEALNGVSAGEKVVAGGALFLDQDKTGN
jgi:cobalt-zinc-cadmium efflux system membrane fusion protein